MIMAEAAHTYEQAELQLAARLHLERLAAAVDGDDAQAHARGCLGRKALPDLAPRQVRPLPPRQRRVVRREHHAAQRRRPCMLSCASDIKAIGLGEGGLPLMITPGPRRQYSRHVQYKDKHSR